MSSAAADGVRQPIIDGPGRARIAAWGTRASQGEVCVTSSARNLQLLGHITEAYGAAAYWYAWGATSAVASKFARSALGEDASGSLLYGLSISQPDDLAQALPTMARGERHGMAATRNGFQA